MSSEHKGGSGRRHYQVHTKLSWANHNRLEHCASVHGNSMNDAVCDLIERGLDSWENEQVAEDLPEKVKLAQATNRTREREEIHAQLVVLALAGENDTNPNSFEERCTAFGFTVQEILSAATMQEIQQTRSNQRTWRAACRWFMRGLLLREPEGVSTQEIMKLAAICGFSENQVRRSLSDIKAVPFWVGRAHFWRLHLRPQDTTLQQNEMQSLFHSEE